ncbi:GNAT family N-acetyltransferase [Duganella sp. FT92W]|uniref:GNAT family N-acetyltransferase n=1 Tax=Pseudoduganella rivuli TaxID=2666085 RepID=A0A7X2ILT0_9BURK|nr:GNAT family N-acetyltransferase [Pseudoduganella rivuli]MRV72387.1 GNAT family N-acetyltransferase [Pseudoduganella rivuli]
MTYQVIKSPYDLVADTWDQLAHPSLYLSSGWLRARSRTVKAAERFILTSGADGKPLASAPCYLATDKAHPGYAPAQLLSFEGLSEPEYQGSAEELAAIEQHRAMLNAHSAAWNPGFVVGAPGRYGGISTRAGLDEKQAADARSGLIDAVEHQAREDGARSISWLYFVEGEDALLEQMLMERGYARLILDAECYMPIRWNNFDDYLAAFRNEYRGTVKHEMAAMDAAGVKVEMHGAEVLGPELAALERQWRLKYGRTPPVEEIVADYEELRSCMPDSLRVFVATLDGRAIGFAVFLEENNIWYSRFGGFDYTAGNLFLYFNLLFYRPIQTMIESGAVSARYSLKSYVAKRSRGCLLRNVLAFVKAPEDSPIVAPAVQAINSAQTARFNEISSKRITKEEA